MTLYNVSAGTASGVVGFSLVTDRPTARLTATTMTPMTTTRRGGRRHGYGWTGGVDSRQASAGPSRQRQASALPGDDDLFCAA